MPCVSSSFALRQPALPNPSSAQRIPSRTLFSVNLPALTLLLFLCLIASASLSLSAQSSLGQASSPQASSPQIHLGYVNVGNQAATLINVIFPKTTTIGSVIILSGGAATGHEFDSATGGSCKTGTTYPANSACTVAVAFEPLYAGNRYGSLQLLDQKGSLIQLSSLRGTGIAPQVSFMPGRQIALDILPEVNGLAVDGDNNVYVSLGAIGAESGSELVYSQAKNGAYALTGQVGSWVEPKGIWLDGAANTYLFDEVQGLWKSGTGPILGSIQPIALTGDAFGNLYLISADSSSVLKETLQPSAFPQDSTYIQSTVNATSASALEEPNGIWLDWSGNLYVADLAGLHKWTVQPDGSFAETYRASFVGRVTVDGAGNLFGYTADLVFHKQTLQPDGSYIQSNISSSIANSSALVADSRGNLYHSDYYSGIYTLVSKDDFTQAPALTYETTELAKSSRIQTVTISNSGTAPLKFSSITFPADFAKLNSGHQCSATSVLLPGARCKLNIVFTPKKTLTPGSAPVSLTEGILIVTNSLNAASARQVIAVSGTESAPEPVATTTALTLTPVANLMSGEKLTLTITVKPDSGKIAPRGTITLASPQTSATVTVPLDQSGKAIIHTEVPGAGHWSLFATYNGSETFARSVSSSISAIVKN